MQAPTESLEPDERGRIIKSAVTPRPIAWISTTSTDGVDNFAPF
ncbi:flavin reductase, partial [Natronobacterium gregoryi SP2]